MSISSKFNTMSRSTSDHQRILATINNILLKYLTNPYVYQSPYCMAQLCKCEMTSLRATQCNYNQSYFQKRHFSNKNKENRRLNRIHQPGFDSQRRDHQRHQRN